MVEKERFSTTLDSELLQEIKILAIRRKCSTNVLIEEAMADLLEKYEVGTVQGEKTRTQMELPTLMVHEDKVEYKKKRRK